MKGGGCNSSLKIISLCLYKNSGAAAFCKGCPVACKRSMNVSPSKHPSQNSPVKPMPQTVWFPFENSIKNTLPAFLRHEQKGAHF
jgi:hypothetical protein